MSLVSIFPFFTWESRGVSPGFGISLQGPEEPARFFLAAAIFHSKEDSRNLCVCCLWPALPSWSTGEYLHLPSRQLFPAELLPEPTNFCTLVPLSRKKDKSSLLNQREAERFRFHNTNPTSLRPGSLEQPMNLCMQASPQTNPPTHAQPCITGNPALLKGRVGVWHLHRQQATTPPSCLNFQR